MKDFPLVISLIGLVAIAHLPAQAQITAVPGDTGTVVTPAGSTITITGGTTTGTNLFHSFQQFGVGTGQTANFVANPAIQNILSRVVGGDPSVIDGAIRITGSNANLYLMNPAGIVFGANARLNVAGSFTATTANGIRLGGNWFSASGANNYGALAGTPDALAFTVDQPGAIVNAGNLAVGDRQKLTLIGGTVVSPGSVAAKQGQVTVASIPGQRLVRLQETGRLLSLDVQPLTAAPSLPNSWLFPVSSLPVLLTGSGLGSATGLTVNGDGSVVLTGSGVQVANGDVVVPYVVPAIAGDPLSIPADVLLTAQNNLTTGNIAVKENGLAPGSSIRLRAVGNVQAGNLQTDTVSGGTPIEQASVNLVSETGNVIVSTIAAGPGGINVTAGGVFQATGTFTPPGYFVDLADYPDQDPTFLPFIQQKTGLTPAQYAAIPFPGSTTGVTTPAPVSLRTYLGNISIQYGGGSRLELTDLQTITVVGNAPFVVGPQLTPPLGDAFSPANLADNFANFAIAPFDLIKNGTYTPITIPAGASGTVGAIVRTVQTDGSLTTSLQDRVFGVLPQSPQSPTTVSPSTPSTPVATGGQRVQRDLTSQTQGMVCGLPGGSRGVAGTRSPAATGGSSACTSIGDQEKILQILTEPNAPVRN